MSQALHAVLPQCSGWDWSEAGNWSRGSYENWGTDGAAAPPTDSYETVRRTVYKHVCPLKFQNKNKLFLFFLELF